MRMMRWDTLSAATAAVLTLAHPVELSAVQGTPSAAVPKAATERSGLNPHSVLEVGSELTVLLITFEAGDDLLSRWGHSAIWIQDPICSST